MESYVPSSSPLSAEELTAYIGPKAERYRLRFERFTRAGTTRFELSWNNPAAFLGIWWYLYRKMYWWGLVDFVLSVLLGWTFFVPILWGVARAVTADYLYFRQADRRIREARPLSSAPGAPAADAAHLARLAAEGGVNTWVPWVAIAGTILFLAILLFAFGWLWNAIPALHELWPAPPGRWT
jgi:amino acid transporter